MSTVAITVSQQIVPQANINDITLSQLFEITEGIGQSYRKSAAEYLRIPHWFSADRLQYHCQSLEKRPP